MSKIVFFNIPAYGHTNPTIRVVEGLIERGHEVWYYSFNMFKDRIESVGAKFISCDEYLPAPPEDEKKIGRDFPALVEMLIDTTINLDEKVCKELENFKPDCIVSDSLSFWGKLFAKKLNIRYICSVTTFAFNKHTARLGQSGVKEMISMLVGMPRIHKKLRLLRANGYEVDNFVSMMENDNNNNSIVYTSKEFQPMSETFSDKCIFVGPSLVEIESNNKDKRKTVYISLGTILNKENIFYKNCIKALKTMDVNVVMSVGGETDISDLGEIPINFEVKDRVDQIKVLSESDVFLTHCGMNSVNESLYYSVPMVLFPQHGEQRMVAARAAELGTGVMLKGKKPKHIKQAIEKILNDSSFQENARMISESLEKAGGAKKAADIILNIIKTEN